MRSFHRDGASARVEPDLRRRLLRLAGFKLSLLDFAIGVGRKAGGFCALLALGWIYFRLLVLGESVHQVHPSAADPDLRQTLWVALLLIMAQGWDIPTDQLAVYWARLHAHLPGRSGRPRGDRSSRARAGLLTTSGTLVKPWKLAEPVIIRLGRFMDVCVAIANKVGAFAVLCYLLFLAADFIFAGATVRGLYPAAADPWVSFLADLCVYVVVLGWWAMPFEQIAIFWRRLRHSGSLEAKVAG